MFQWLKNGRACVQAFCEGNEFRFSISYCILLVLIVFQSPGMAAGKTSAPTWNGPKQITSDDGYADLSWAVHSGQTAEFYKITESFDLGMYLILVFSIVVASMVDLSNLGTPTFALLGYLSFVIFGSLFLQLIISKFTKTDTDTMIITSAALICSPPFVPVVSGALKNKEILVPGITIGIIGYAVGNYLGFLMSELLQHWPF